MADLFGRRRPRSHRTISQPLLVQSLGCARSLMGKTAYPYERSLRHRALLSPHVQISIHPSATIRQSSGGPDQRGMSQILLLLDSEAYSNNDLWNPIKWASWVNSTRFCTDPRDKLFASLSLPGVLAQQIPLRIKPDHSLTLEETAAVTIARLESVTPLEDIAKHPRSYHHTSTLLGIECNTGEFGTWLRRRAHWIEQEKARLLHSVSAMEINCSGYTLHHLMYHWPFSPTCDQIRCSECEKGDCLLCADDRELARSDP